MLSIVEYANIVKEDTFNSGAVTQEGAKILSAVLRLMLCCMPCYLSNIRWRSEATPVTLFDSLASFTVYIFTWLLILLSQVFSLNL